MSQSSLPFGLTGPILARSTATLFGLLGTTVGARAFLQPLAFAEAFGLPQSQTITASDESATEEQKSNPFIPALGARNIASGITLLVLAYQKNDRALGICMMSGIFVGIADSLLVLNYPRGVKDAGIGHLVMTGIFTSVGAYLYLLH